MQLPPPFNIDADEEAKDPEASSAESPPKDPDTPGRYAFPQSAPLSASPPRLDNNVESGLDSPRSRRKSLPSAQPSPQGVTFAPGPMIRPRRNSSIHEPSPLARLFVRSPDDTGIVDRLRERRQSLVQSLGIPYSSSQPALSSIISPRNTRFHGHIRTNSQPQRIHPELPIRQSHRSRPSITPIEEGKRLSFSHHVEPSEASSSHQSRGPGVPFPKSPEPDSSIGKASEIAERVAEKVPGGSSEEVTARLDKIDQRQKRIEEMLERLVAGDTGGDGDRRDRRRRRSRERLEDEDEDEQDDVFGSI